MGGTGRVVPNLGTMTSNGEILTAVIGLRDFVAEKSEQTATKGEFRELGAELRTEMRAGFDRVDRRLHPLESRVEDLETRAKT